MRGSIRGVETQSLSKQLEIDVEYGDPLAAKLSELFQALAFQDEGGHGLCSFT